MIKNDHKYKESKEWDYNIHGNKRNKNHLKDRYCFKLTAEMTFDKRIGIYWLYILIEEGINLLIACYY